MGGFTSYDGADKDGVRAEVHVQTGPGIVTHLISAAQGKTFNVKFRSTIPGMKRPISAWVTAEDPLMKVLEEAKESGREVEYRVESQRKPHVDRKTPIAELRKTQDIAIDNVKSILAGIDGTLGLERVTDPSEDPVSSHGRYVADDSSRKPGSGGSGSGGAGFSPEAALAGLANARQAGMDPAVVAAAQALALMAGVSPADVESAGVDAGSRQRPTQQRAVAVEAAPFKPYNSDGRPNAGSYAVQAVLSVDSMVRDLVRDKKIDLNEEGVREVASALLSAADAVQASVVGSTDRMSNSHTRARGVVFNMLKDVESFAQSSSDPGIVSGSLAATINGFVDEASARYSWAVETAFPDVEEIGENTDQGSGGSADPHGWALNLFSDMVADAGYDAATVSGFAQKRYGVDSVAEIDTEKFVNLMVWVYGAEGESDEARAVRFKRLIES